MKEIMCPDYLRIQLTVAWLNLTMPNRTVKTGLKAKKIKFLQINFFPEKELKKQLFHVPISTFHSAIFF